MMVLYFVELSGFDKGWDKDDHFHFLFWKHCWTPRDQWDPQPRTATACVWISLWLQPVCIRLPWRSPHGSGGGVSFLGKATVGLTLELERPLLGQIPPGFKLPGLTPGLHFQFYIINFQNKSKNSICDRLLLTWMSLAYCVKVIYSFCS